MTFRSNTSIKRKLANRLRKYAEILETPGALHAARRNIPLAWHQLFGRLREDIAIKTILDVGANRGQFSRCCLEAFPNMKVHAFEPLPSCQADLEALQRDNPNLTIHKVALGDKAGIVEMKESTFSPASSLLTTEPRHHELWPFARVRNTVNVVVETLDTIADKWAFDHPVFIKIDVQGFELRVLRGAERLLHEVSAVMLEVAFEPLFKGQPDFMELIHLLAEYELRFVGFADEERVPPYMSLIFGDALFLRS